MAHKLSVTLVLAALTTYSLLVACGSDDQAKQTGAGGEAVTSGGEGGAAGGSSDTGSSSAVAGGAGGVREGGGGAGASPEGGASLGGEATGGAASSGAGGESTGSSLVQGHCYYVANGYCVAWGLTQAGADALAGECADDEADSITECFIGFYGKCVTRGPNGSFVNEHYYQTLGGLSRAELEPQTKAACENRSVPATWVSTPE
jgi:hypothetical protein